MLSTIINLKTLNAVNIAASKGGARYYLNGVLVECRADSVTYVATDGHRMLVVQEDFSEADLERLNESGHARLIGNFIVPSDAIVALKPKGKRAEETALMSAESNTAAKSTLGDRIVTFIDGTFPDWRRAIPGAPTETPASQTQQFNLSYLHDFKKFADAMADTKTSVPHIHHGSHEEPCAVTFASVPKAFGVVMPVRNNVDAWTGAPAWINEKRAKSETMAAE